MSHYLGLDIGGANLKASDGAKHSVSVPFPLWQKPEQLADALQELLDSFPDTAELAVTMTGELADCFQTREVGVNAILDAVEQIAQGRSVHVWLTADEFCEVEHARELVQLVAAANWHALATWAARAAPQGAGLLIDLGSTTCDIIPLLDGQPVPEGRTDRERLASGELVYAGVKRTPVCALASDIELNGVRYGLAAELFATTLDLFLLTGEIPGSEADCNTANGQSATRTHARHRLSRMVCSDTDDLSKPEIDELALQFRRVLIERISSAIRRVITRLEKPVKTVMISGEGEFLLDRILSESFPELSGFERLSLNRLLGPDHSASACAYALANLARERC